MLSWIKIQQPRGTGSHVYTAARSRHNILHLVVKDYGKLMNYIAFFWFAVDMPPLL